MAALAMIYTSANCHLGDVFWSCLALRKLGGRHQYYMPTEYHWQIAELLEGKDVTLLPLEDAPPEAKNTWIACARFEPRVVYRGDTDLVAYLMAWSNQLCEEAGEGHHFQKREDLLFDAPAILRHVDVPEFDALVINCPPRSGQCPGWKQDESDALIQKIGEKHRTIVTNPTTATNVHTISASVCGIGNLSLRAKFVVAVASGGHWMIWNKWATGDVPFYIFLDPIVLNFSEKLKVQFHGHCKGMAEALEKDGWL